MPRLAKPGGTVLIVGCYRSVTASDYLIDAVAIPANLLAGLLKSRNASSGPDRDVCTYGSHVHDAGPGQEGGRRRPARGPSSPPLVLEVHPELHGRLNGHSPRTPDTFPRPSTRQYVESARSDGHRTANGMSHCPRQPDLWSPQADRCAEHAVAHHNRWARPVVRL